LVFDNSAPDRRHAKAPPQVPPIPQYVLGAVNPVRADTHLLGRNLRDDTLDRVGRERTQTKEKVAVRMAMGFEDCRRSFFAVLGVASIM
jgi:hypothetical protein